MTVHVSILAQKLNIFTSCHALFSENCNFFQNVAPGCKNPLERFDHPSSQKEVPQKIPQKFLPSAKNLFFTLSNCPILVKILKV